MSQREWQAGEHSRCRTANRALLLRCTVACLVLASATAWPVMAAEKPNVVIILADDMGYADAAFQGGRDVPTPHIDSLAHNGVQFTNGYVSHPFCSPTRAGLLTGRYQQRFGHENNPAYLPEDTTVGLPVDQVTLSQMMKDAGYATGLVGKWHLGAAPCFYPSARGFTDFFGFLGGGHSYFPTPPGRAEYAIPILRNNVPVAETGYLTDDFGREAAAFVTRHKDEHFFLYLAFNAVHTPMQAPADLLAKYAAIEDPVKRTHAGMLDSMDQAIGKLLNALKEHDLESRTLVVFLSDNGGPVGVNGSSNAPLRGAKGQMYEGGIRVPFVMQWKGTLPAGTTYTEPVISLDLAPTTLAIAGAQVPPQVQFDGVNLMPYLLEAKSGTPHDRLHWRGGGGYAWAVREGRWKLLKIGQGQPELYDLSADIAETRNLAADEPAVAAKLLAAHEAWNSELISPLFQSPPQGKAATKKAQQKAQAKGKAAAAKKAAIP